jgi:hypothetical protein
LRVNRSLSLLSCITRKTANQDRLRGPTCRALLGGTVEPSRRDRRSSRLTVHELRQFLREADEDRFRLAAALRECRARLSRMNGGTWRPLVVVILVAAGLGSSTWTVNAPAGPPKQQFRTGFNVAFATTETAARTADGKLVSAPISGVARRHRRSTRIAQKPLMPRTPSSKAAPRPLSPGEFGRTPEEIARIFAERTSPRSMRKS